MGTGARRATRLEGALLVRRRTLADVLGSQRDSSGRPKLHVRAIAALTLLGLLVLSAPLVLVPLLGWLVDLLS
jgi:hypothetical protein